jgi:hypothetical protein
VRLQPGASVVGHLSATATGLVMQRHHAVPLTKYRVPSDKIRHTHAVEDIIYYSYLLCRITYGLTYLEATYRVSKLIVTIRP